MAENPQQKLPPDIVWFADEILEWMDFSPGPVVAKLKRDAAGRIIWTMIKQDAND